jgi:hypothetical protein
MAPVIEKALREKNPLLAHLVTMEMAGMVESWMVDDDAIHLLLKEPVTKCGCRQERWWFVNRDGRTLCHACDGEARREKSGQMFSQKGAAVLAL